MSRLSREYKDLIFTNHALERLEQRNISQAEAWATWHKPDLSRKANSKNAQVYYRTYGKRKIEVVASQNKRGEWVVLSVWDKAMDERQREAAGSLWQEIKKQIGLLFRGY